MSDAHVQSCQCGSARVCVCSFCCLCVRMRLALENLLWWSSQRQEAELEPPNTGSGQENSSCFRRTPKAMASKFAPVLAQDAAQEPWECDQIFLGNHAQPLHWQCILRSSCNTAGPYNPGWMAGDALISTCFFLAQNSSLGRRTQECQEQSRE